MVRSCPTLSIIMFSSFLSRDRSHWLYNLSNPFCRPDASFWPNAPRPGLYRVSIFSSIPSSRSWLCSYYHFSEVLHRSESRFINCCRYYPPGSDLSSNQAWSRDSRTAWHRLCWLAVFQASQPLSSLCSCSSFSYFCAESWQLGCSFFAPSSSRCHRRYCWTEASPLAVAAQSQVPLRSACLTWNRLSVDSPRSLEPWGGPRIYNLPRAL